MAIESEIHLTFGLTEVTPSQVTAQLRIYRTFDITIIFGYSLIQIEAEVNFFDIGPMLLALARRAQTGRYPKRLQEDEKYLMYDTDPTEFVTLEYDYSLQRVAQKDWGLTGYDIRNSPDNHFLYIELYYTNPKAPHDDIWPEAYPDYRYPERRPDGDGNVARYGHSSRQDSEYEDTIYTEWDYTSSTGYVISSLPILWLYLHQQGADALGVDLDLSDYNPLESGDIQYYDIGYPGYRGEYAGHSEYGSMVHYNSVSIPGGYKKVVLITIPARFEREYRRIDEAPGEDWPTKGPFLPIPFLPEGPVTFPTGKLTPQIGTWQEHPKIAKRLSVDGKILEVDGKQLSVKQWLT